MTSNRRISPEKCDAHFHGAVMAPLAYPSVGWEPVMEADDCEREKGHEGAHQGKRIEWKAVATFIPRKAVIPRDRK